jgi:hypothetical protein
MYNHCSVFEETMKYVFVIIGYQDTRCYQKVPGLGQKRNAGLTYSILTAISFKMVSLGMYTAIPSFFLLFKSTVEVISLNAFKYRL